MLTRSPVGGRVIAPMGFVVSVQKYELVDYNVHVIYLFELA